MAIEQNQVVQFHYVLIDLSEGSNEQIESSYVADPQAILIGHKQMLPTVEAEMQQHESGDKFSIQLSPEQAYGEKKDQQLQRVPIKHLLTKRKKYRPGQIVNVNTAEGTAAATIVKVGKFNVDVDSNHPLAGKTLQFDIEIVSVRDATEEEIAHGHAHGVGGHHH